MPGAGKNPLPVRGKQRILPRNQNPLYPHGAMNPRYAIAPSERPLKYVSAAGCRAFPSGAECYESFTINALSGWGEAPTFARVMTGRKPMSLTATRSAFVAPAHMRRTNLHAMQFSAQNVLFLTPTSDLRSLTSVNCQLKTDDCQLLLPAN